MISILIETEEEDSRISSVAVNEKTYLSMDWILHNTKGPAVTKRIDSCLKVEEYWENNRLKNVIRISIG